ncbi:MAG: T9SS type A sorting domain-containing protein [Bacteroidia bacterium]|nr:T9SS type A sorting domain-containing protein [Bacteroidia bacterium]
MKQKITFLLFVTISVICFQPSTAQIDTSFFPQFTPQGTLPIIKYGDGFADAAWNDPCLLKENGQYIMYISAAVGITGVNKVKIYRQVSTDGINWSLSPTTPVLEPLTGSYYEGGVETPSVVVKDNVYHMYTTCYPANVAEDFLIAHATSSDGITWTMDVNPVLESPGTATWYGSIVGEPGVMLYNDSIRLFFTAGGILNTSPIQCIGMMSSADGTNFNTPQIAVTLPNDVYPAASGYWGLSTPSPLAINDSIYLFTDVAQVINGAWTQVALHQFKCEALNGNWYHDDAPIHTRGDFSWTNGNYLSEIRSITPLMDDNGLLRVYYAGNHIADISGTDTTYNVTVDGSGIHVMPDYWGIGLSTYQFPVATSIEEMAMHTLLYPNPASDQIMFESTFNALENYYSIMSIEGKVLLNGSLKPGKNSINISSLSPGIYFFKAGTISKKFIKQ